jgi:hypothetical protein
MTHSIIWKEQTRFIEDAVESWKLLHEEAMQALEVDAVLEMGVVLGNYVRKLMSAAWEELFSGQLTNVQAQGASFQKAFNQSAQAFADLADMVRAFADSGHELPHYPPFVAAHEQLLHLKSDFERRWPRFDGEALEAKRNSSAEYVDPEEIYREFPEIRRADSA